MSFFMLTVLFTLSVILYYYFATFDITSTNFSVKAIQSRILLRQTLSDSHILLTSTARTPRITKPLQSTIARKRKLDINVEKNLTRLNESLQRLSTPESFSYFLGYKDRKKCKKRKACPTDTPVGHYRTCALVGNSGILLKSNCGNEIDSHDYVIRMNMAALKNYEQDVGRQTNLSFINWKRIKELGKEIASKKKRKDVLQHLTLLNGSVFSYVKLKTKDAISALESLETILKNNSLNITVTYSRSNVPLVFTRPLRETFIPRLKSPTSGLIAYILASRFCDIITMYGFYPFATDMRNRTLFYHYYDTKSVTKSYRSRHNFIIEHNFFTLLHNSGLVRLVTDICE
ncbi:alpha-2,8-sialyltransferase 8B-like [Branchiostoma floridae x Branchiostoma belcheri]